MRYQCAMSFKWTDGFYFENSQRCSSELQYRIDDLSTEDALSGYTIEVEWSAQYLISVRIKLVFQEQGINSISIYESVRIEPKDLNNRGY